MLRPQAFTHQVIKEKSFKHINTFKLSSCNLKSGTLVTLVLVKKNNSAWNNIFSTGSTVTFLSANLIKPVFLIFDGL